VALADSTVPACDAGAGLPVVGPRGETWITAGKDGAIASVTYTGAITEHFLPMVDGASFAGITSGPDGAVWFTTTTRVGRMASDGTVTFFAPPGASSNGFGTLGGITTGPDGDLWFADGLATSSGPVNAVVRMTPSGTMTAFPTGGRPSAITMGPDGRLWVTVARFSKQTSSTSILAVTTSGVMTEFPDPSANASPLVSIVSGPDGALWYDLDADRTGRITTAGVVSHITVPGPQFSNIGGLGAGPTAGSGSRSASAPDTRRSGPSRQRGR